MSHLSVTASDWNYEETVTKLEEIIEQVESGELTLEEVFEQFATAVEYLQQCEQFLQKGRQQMNLLISTLDDDLEF